MPEVTRFVAIHLPGTGTPVPAGRLTMLEQGEQTLSSRFSYGRRYLERANALPVDPVSLPLDARARREDQAPINGLNLFGAIRDATPDAWGRRVIENQLKAAPGTLAERSTWTTPVPTAWARWTSGRQRIGRPIPVRCPP
jgi:serine/threonine-protein kinase HipA